VRVLVTGGLGFIGHNIVKILEQQGHEALIIDNRTNYGFVPHDELDYLLRERSKNMYSPIYPIDIRDSTGVEFVFQHFRPDVVIHCASFPRQKVVSADPILGSQVMTTGLINLLEHAEKARLKKFLYISSSMVYGDFENDVTEDAECDPIGQYAIMKLMGEYLVKDYSRRTGMEYTIVRPSAVYGDWDVEDRVVSKFMLGAMRGDTLKVRGADEVLDFTYVKDTAMGIVQAALAANTHAKIYNITRSDSRLYTLLDAAKLAISIAKKGQIKIEGKDTEFPSRGRLSIDLARKDFGYDPKVSVEEGFELYHKWFKESTFWQTRI
tara:strand:+ start:1191 stop:2159 length:969 start_codon:yes stop_codon:yes gene_type:complete